MAMSTTSIHVTPLGSGMSQFLGVFAGGFTIEQPTKSPFNDLQIQPNPMRISISQPIQNTKIHKKRDKKSHLEYVLDGKNQISCLFVDLAWVYMFKVGWTQKTLNY